jgi:predicted O-linked N-acetylglucosamine transferase (SPINDLY family)
MGVFETIAQNVDEYVSTAVRLARDGLLRSRVVDEISRNKDRVYRDGACIAALEDFLDREARREASAPM